MPSKIVFNLSTPHKEVSFVEHGDRSEEIGDVVVWVVLLGRGWVCCNIQSLKRIRRPRVCSKGV
jgi:hypothetical protein